MAMDYLFYMFVSYKQVGVSWISITAQCALFIHASLAIRCVRDRCFRSLKLFLTPYIPDCSYISSVDSALDFFHLFKFLYNF